MNEETKKILTYVVEVFNNRGAAMFEKSDRLGLSHIAETEYSAVSDTYASAAEFVQELLDND